MPESVSSTDPGRDHLTSLPPELIHNILSYLFPTHIPDRRTCYGRPPSPHRMHALLHLSQTSRSLHAEIQTWAHHQLLTWKAQTNYRPLQNPLKQSERNFLSLLMTWSRRTCVFCGRRSQRVADLMNGLNCCRACDRREFEKMTKTAARENFDLKDAHLLGPAPHVRPFGVRVEEVDGAPCVWLPDRYFADVHGIGKRGKRGGGSPPRRWPPLRYGLCWKAGVTTTMFACADVEARAAEVHGPDWRGHLARREARRVERRKAQLAKAGELVSVARALS